MKLNHYFLYLLLFVSGIQLAMERSKNWVVTRVGEGKNLTVLWKGTDAKEMVMLRFEPFTGSYSGKRINFRWPGRELPMQPERVRQYLVELKEIPEKA